MDTSMTKRDLVLHMQAHHRDVLAVLGDVDRTLRMFDKGTLERWHEQSRTSRLEAGLPEHDSVRPRPGDQCDDTCTTDCGHCKGAGR